MSLIDQAAKNLSPYKLMMQETASKNEERKFIVQPNILMDILNDEMSSRVIDKKQRKEFAGYRTRLKTSEWRLAGILNHVDEAIYRVQIEKTIESMLKHIRLVQPNGEWLLMEYETDIRPNKNGDQVIMLAAKFVDAKNETDMRYQNGVPLVDVKVDVSGSNKELIEAIQAQGSTSNDQELKDLLKQLITVTAQQQINSAASPNKADATFDEIPEDMTE
tara:strand:+ start:2297 stop:2953 length:657 start_codon:yes stop_codon:yes gene_type:complete